MKIFIYGKDSCSYCKRAVELAKQLKYQGHGDYEYIDIVEAGIDAVALGNLVGKPVRTVPQIFVDGEPIGGYTELSAFMTYL
ncbi:MULTISPECIES: GrxA family glutaredoxin [Klebsiella pneumoniae complex]|uniref:GrxA family glutaredoxin n=1 Tax=Klebsiella pneumoniae complex TaxID=3390273 RepID=UPI000651C337|nr:MULTISPECIES: GrxA family glutaredoxin [Klebsiella]HDG7717247.1 GrxA family glutaredoxin [Klebsiella quasipneumoniae]KMI48634.1 GrxA family glutaredoxin [Klebsiella pneumoniae]KSZ29372.1 glutaredoxin [Klebsiella variicola]MCM6238511.1 GrxA family glutaredoxin [Klebsiella pneumoniae]PVZ90755.1 GrxA family glutaredoxin [Klebsiella pneumoniae]